MATVKGDVHDIGKNIVGVVLGCNGYRIVDLGVMVPWPKILETARAENADAIGLSGLITPSLEEMRTVAQEMEREGMTLPLLIGGATTSRAHTAVRLEPAYSGPVVHVADASRAVGVVRSLLDVNARDEFMVQTRDRYADAAPPVRRSRRSGRSRLTIEEARANRVTLDWTANAPPQANVPGLTRARRRSARGACRGTSTGRPSSPPGSCPATTRRSSRTRGWARRRARSGTTPRSCSSASSTSRCSAPTAVVGFWPAASTADDDIVLYTDDSRSTELDRLHTLRQQMAKPDGRPNVALSDYIAPVESGVRDYIGAFAVTAGGGLDEAKARFEAAGDDYSAILLTSLADRLAEAMAEWLHAKVRRELWGYAPSEALDNDALIAESYQGIRPAPGYPAQPRPHREAHDLPAARRRASGRHPPDRVDGDGPGLIRQRTLLLASRGEATSASAGSAATSSPTTRGARAGPSPRQTAGWPSTWPKSARRLPPQPDGRGLFLWRLSSALWPRGTGDKEGLSVHPCARLGFK